MNSRDVKRRLTTILAADVAGYSRLMAVDETGTLAQLKAQRKDVFRPKLAECRGRVVKLMGDGVLMEFGSVVDAVHFAVDVQRALAERDATLPEAQRLVHRIGINIGDIIVEGKDIYGDGVNVAARLEVLAEPGGICVSRNVFNQVKNKVDVGFEDLGEQHVKNIPEPVHAYRVLLEPEAAGALIEETPPKSNTWKWAAAAAVVVIAVAGSLAWWQPWVPRVEPASLEKMAFPLPDKPSIAVLPFTNMSDDRAQAYFADGITEDIITDLSKISGLFVIARNSTFVYKGKAVKIRKVAEDLGVRYVLEGSVRRDGDQIRINAQLIDATTGGHVWADRYDGSHDDVFGFQDRVTRDIVAALSVKLTSSERKRRARRDTVSTEAHDAFLKGRIYFRRNTPEDFAKAVPYFEKAIAFDPQYGRAHAALAAVYQGSLSRDFTSGIGEWTRSLGLAPDDILPRVKRYLRQAGEAPGPLVHQVASQLRSYQGRHDEALAEAGRGIALDENDPLGHEAMAAALIFAGRPEEGAGAIGTAMRLDPQYPHEYLFWLGLAQFGMERFDQAARTLSRAVELNPDDDRALIVLAAAWGHSGRAGAATAAIDTLNKLRSAKERRRSRTPERNLVAGIDTFVAGAYTLQDVDLWPFKERGDRERLREGLRKAGLSATGAAAAESPFEVPGATTVNAAKAKALHGRGVPFVDVRAVADWNIGHIPGAVHLELKEVFSEAALLRVVGKGTEVVILCEGPKCLRSSKASAKAVSWGFTRVYYFRDGFPAWRAAGYPVEVVTD